MINWFGQESHPTDSYIHWTEENPKKLAELLRHEYDAIVGKDLSNELKVLLDAAYSAGQKDESDSNNPDL